MFFNDPENLQEYLKPVGGEVFIRPKKGSTFSADICLNRLNNIGLFRITADSFFVSKEEQYDFYGLTIPLSAPFTSISNGREKVYSSSLAYMLLPGRNFDFSSINKCDSIVANFNMTSISHYSKKVLQLDNDGLSAMSSDVLLSSPDGSHLLRAIAHAWSVLKNKLPTNELMLRELEDNLLASLVLYSSSDMKNCHPFKSNESYRFNRTIEFINENLKNPITRDTLAEVSGRSIRSLSRTFEKKYGVGPMNYIKQRRLDAAFIELISLSRDRTSVMKTALDYGFLHTGRFAIEYKKAFGESPSESLSK